MIYLQNKIVSASLCDESVRLSCIGAFGMVEDSLTELMGELEIDGLTAMKKYNAIWLFTKNHIKFLKSVDWKESVTVESYVALKSRIRLYIDTCIKNRDREICVYSRVELCGIDKDSLRIRKIETIGVDDTVCCEPARQEIEFFSKDDVAMKAVDSVVVKSSNIDYAHHTNNVEYIRFMINTFSSEQLCKNPVKEMEVHYLNQSFEGDRLEIYKGELRDRAVFGIARGETDIIKCDMRF